MHHGVNFVLGERFQAGGDCEVGLDKNCVGGTRGRWPSTRRHGDNAHPRAKQYSAQMLPMYPAAPVSRIIICKFSTSRSGQNRRRLRAHTRMARSVPKYWNQLCEFDKG